jgi:hypothetical protein
VLTFGEDQKGFKLRLATDQGKDICGRMRGASSLISAHCCICVAVSGGRVTGGGERRGR